jgi:hypothetical protein
MDNCLTPQRESQITERIVAINKQIDILEKSISELKGRLGTVLRIEPACDPVKDAGMPAIVPLANNLRLIQDKIGDNVNEINLITRLIEL